MNRVEPESFSWARLGINPPVLKWLSAKRGQDVFSDTQVVVCRHDAADIVSCSVTDTIRVMLNGGDSEPDLIPWEVLDGLSSGVIYVKRNIVVLVGCQDGGPVARGDVGSYTGL